MPLDYVAWCHKNGFDYNKVDHHDAWHRYVDAEMRQPHPTPLPGLNGRITRTWMQDREAELRRRSHGFMRVIWPRHALRLISL